jgi:hypothetical protein
MFFNLYRPRRQRRVSGLSRSAGTCFPWAFSLWSITTLILPDLCHLLKASCPVKVGPLMFLRHGRLTVSVYHALPITLFIR